MPKEVEYRHVGISYSAYSRKLLLLGSGELGKEVIIEAQRLGVETVAVDRYDGAPAMGLPTVPLCLICWMERRLRSLSVPKPDVIVPEIEAIATDALLELEEEGFCVVPTARATRLTMDREGIRRLAAEKLGYPTAEYRFADSLEELRQAVGNWERRA